MDIRRTNEYTDYFGFDLGDGESALAWLRAGSRTEPQLIELRGRKSVLSAVGVHPERGVLIGEEACYAAGLDELYSRFKSRFLSEPDEAGRVVRLFVAAVVQELENDGRFEDIDRALFFVGCPSGWDQRARERYRAVLEGAGLKNVQVVSESRAAFMYARESGELKLSSELTALPTLILDAGSSTTDFTYVFDLRERSLVLDFGEVRLGGGLIDRMLLEVNVSRHPQAEELRRIFDRFPQYYSRCELEARKVKEMYFTDQSRGGARDLVCESSVKIYSGHQPITLDLDASEADMQRILNQPLPELGDRSFVAAMRDALIGARELLAGEPVQAILLTGGASRMSFVADLCAQAFPDAAVMRGLEPEFAIARGLCHALRIDRRIGGFYGELDELMDSASFRAAVTDAMSRLMELAAEAIADELIESAAPEVFRLWRSGQLRAMDDMADELSRRMRELSSSGALKARMEPAVRAWLQEVRPYLEELTDPICDRYDLPRTSLRIAEMPDIDASGLIVPSSRLIRMDELKLLIDVVTGAIMAALMGGGGVALIMSGPAGWAMGLIIGIIAGVFGGEVVERLMRRAEMPPLMRKMFTMASFERGLKARRSKIARGIADHLSAGLHDSPDEARRMADEIAAAIGRELTHMADRAALMIH